MSGLPQKIEVFRPTLDDLATAERERLKGAAKAPDPDPWPVLDDAARYGLAGEIVAAIEPHTEGDPLAILLQTLVAFGALVGRGPHVRVEGDQHHSNEFIVLVGTTAKGRKGTSWGRVRQLFEPIPGWPRTPGGLSTGEGIKWAVRDPIEGTDKDGNVFLKDPGESDKRLLAIEPEFCNVLRHNARQGNTLSATLRQAWDSGRLETLTKNDPVVATGAHISIIGHITRDELRAELCATDQANGFANRFLFACVKRSKVLPFGGDALPDEVVADFTRRLAEAADKARFARQVTMTSVARDLWASVYPQLSEGFDGLLGAVTARSEAHVLRLALGYALLNCRSEIDGTHLSAGLAAWDYCEQSARHIFGSALGDRVADEILRALRAAGPDGLTRTQLSNLFQRHTGSERIQQALGTLEERRLAVMDTRSTGGRPVEFWVSANAN